LLQELVIHDFAIIESLDLSFERGMTALTGETGAGKSIIIDAVSLLAGARGSSEFIRTGAKKATLQGMFYAADNEHTKAELAKIDLELDDGQLLLERDLYASGRNVCRVNGQLVNTATLRAIGETLVDIHGQNEHQELTRPESHVHLLDQFGGPKLQQLLSEYTGVFATYQKRAAALRKKNASEQEWAQRLDMLRFQVDEISAANLTPTLEDELEVEHERLANFQRIQESLGEAYAALSGDEFNPLDAVGTAQSTMADISNLDPAYSEIADNIASAYYTLQDAQNDLSRQIDSLEWDEDRLNAVEEQLDTLQQLRRKYGDTISDVITYGQQAEKELASMEATEADASGLEEQVAQLRAQVVELGQQLTSARHAAATKLEAAVHQQLQALYMAKTVFSVNFAEVPEDEYSAFGHDSVEFYIQPNPGERAQPLAKIASGGELSRIMLALKTIFAESDGVTSIIFDEVDTGVSGRVAQAIANKIVTIGMQSQVLCITHLPQVAAMADHEYKIRKDVTAGRTQTTVTPLNPDERVDELARMLAGEEITPLTLQHARELLSMAADTRKKLAAGDQQ
jgi:DNA repair protein RecN (Recombination protein N)